VSLSSERRNMLFLCLSGVFIATALLGELTGGKLIRLGPFVMSVGVLAWPVVFLTTDLVNEYFGLQGVRRLTFLTVLLIVMAFGVLSLGSAIPAADISPVSDAAFSQVFNQSKWIIVGSLCAFLISQFIDAWVFVVCKRWTAGKKLWLRASGSTAVSQWIDSFVVIGIAFWLPGTLTFQSFITLALSNYVYKCGIAVLLTVPVYAAHAVIDKYLEKA
jgi:uncharacterized integral membrane protein (TIGR00697 family)